ncbi:MAG: hypothetical protein MJA29_07685 [Candidatus Omnitrophica bacterium]|nr:hypothetical protein [Candidatus Omnitrophota bacterium]
MSDTDKSSAIVVQDAEYPEPPEGIRVLSNGAGYCETEKRIKYGPGTFGPDPYRIDKSNASALANDRWDKLRTVADEGVALAAMDELKLSNATVEDGWRNIVKFRAQNAMKNEGHAGTKDADFTAKAINAFPSNGNGTQPPTDGARLELGQGAADKLIDILGGLLAQKSEESQTID